MLFDYLSEKHNVGALLVHFLVAQFVSPVGHWVQKSKTSLFHIFVSTSSMMARNT